MSRSDGDLARRYPRTVEALSAFGGLGPGGALAHLNVLERGFLARPSPIAIADGGPSGGAMDYDVALAGGGLSLLYAAYLARAGWKVVVFDRGHIGRGHREWNISRRELSPLVESALFTDEEVDALILLQYRRGIVRWHGGTAYPVSQVLDCSVDARALLTRLRELCLAAGATLLDGHRLCGYRVGRGGVALDLSPDSQSAQFGEAERAAQGRGTSSKTLTLTTRLLVDGMGATSPHARFDLVCPTVGGVLTGLERGTADDQMDPTCGEILVSTEDVEEGRQHIWEGFPTRGAVEEGRSTVYLFYYAEPDTLGERPLHALYERFFRLRARYKRGPAVLEKPTYGFIPAYTRLRPIETAPSDRVVLVGDAAGRHSPLTFCGFGSMVRSFRPVADNLRRLLEEDRLGRSALSSVWHEPPSLRLLGALALMMIPTGERGKNGPPRGEGERLGDGEINRLLDTAFGVLASLGDEVYGAMVRDEIAFRDFARFMLLTSKRRPSIYREVFSHLTPTEIATWSMHFGRSALGL